MTLCHPILCFLKLWEPAGPEPPGTVRAFLREVLQHLFVGKNISKRGSTAFVCLEMVHTYMYMYVFLTVPLTL